MDTNPETIQPPSPDHPAASLPLVLVHDGGGTTFAYHCLPPLPRAVYGIHNPRFEAGGRWDGGVPEMARAYAALVRDLAASSPAGGILLGGWSMGGYLSLELAALLPRGLVRGIVLVDSPFPAGDGAPVHDSLPPLGPDATRSQRLARTCIENAPAHLVGWRVPEATVPAVLIRARDPVPVERGTEGNPIDAKRGEEDLGWRGRGGVRTVLEVEGHHFDLFDFGRVDRTAKAIEKACRELEGAAVAA